MRAFAALAVLLLVWFNAALADTRENAEFEGAKRVSDLFLAKCIAPLRNFEGTNLDDLTRFTDAKIEELETATGNSFDGWKVWGHTQVDAVLLLEEASNPNPCTMASFNADFEVALTIWEDVAKFDGIRMSSMFQPSQSSGSDESSFRESGGGAIHVSGADFLQVTGTYIGNTGKGTLILAAVRIPSSKFACGLFPEKCSE